MNTNKLLKILKVRKETTVKSIEYNHRGLWSDQGMVKLTIEFLKENGTTVWRSWFLTPSEILFIENAVTA